MSMKIKTDRKKELIAAFTVAINEMGLEAFKQCSIFGSADCHKKGVAK